MKRRAFDRATTIAPASLVAALVLATSALLNVACDPPPAGKPLKNGALPANVIGACGGETIDADTLLAVAHARRSTPAAAFPLLLADACLAEGAKRRSLPDANSLAIEHRRVLSRSLLTEIASSAHVVAPVSEADIARVRRERWNEIDHDAAVTIFHAVATFPEKGPRDPERLRGLANKIHEAVAGVTSVEAFRTQAATAVASDPNVRIEALPPVLRDGRVLGPGEEQFDTVFAEAAHRLTKVGEISDVLETRFGFHVLLLTERIPAVHLETERLRDLIAPEVRTQRARSDLEALLTQLRQQSPPIIYRDAGDLLARPTFRAAGSPP